MSQLPDPVASRDVDTLVDAVLRSLQVLRRLRQEAGHDTASSLNLFFTNGSDCVGLRYSFDFGCYPTDPVGPIDPPALAQASLWYALGDTYCDVDGRWQMVGDPAATRSLIVASEPSPVDGTGWVELPQYSLPIADTQDPSLRVETVGVDV